MRGLQKVWSKLRSWTDRGCHGTLFLAKDTGKSSSNYPACVAQTYPLEFPAAQRSTETVLQAIKGVDTSLLARHSPDLRDFDWAAYLNCSVVRVAQTAAAIRRLLRAGRSRPGFWFLLRELHTGPA